jgi:transposase
MRFYTKTHKHYCGIDLHARKMFVCILDAEGNVLLHRNICCNPQDFLRVIAPFREGLAVGVECMFAWYWLADLCCKEGIDFVLGHALYMKAIHGGKAKSDKIDAHKIAALLRGGMFPMAYVYPPEMRATRDLMRRRTHFVRKRAELLAHIQNTVTQYNLPVIGVNLSVESNRQGVVQGIADLFPDPEVQKIVLIDLAMIDAYDDTLKALDWEIEKTARQHNCHALLLLRSVHGIGSILALVMLYEIHEINRFETVQQFASYCRLVKCAHESAGKKKGAGGAKIGNAHLKWAFSEAAMLFIRHNPSAKNLMDNLIKLHGKGKALSILAHKLARAIYYMLKNNKPFDREKFLATA